MLRMLQILYGSWHLFFFYYIMCVDFYSVFYVVDGRGPLMDVIL